MSKSNSLGYINDLNYNDYDGITYYYCSGDNKYFIL